MTRLDEWFDTYNKRYFRGRLPKCRVVWTYRKVDFIGRFLYDTDDPDKGLLIELSHRIRFVERVARFTLLHEMVHLKQRHIPDERAHGHAFQKEMKRLANAGAFNGLW